MSDAVAAPLVGTWVTETVGDEPLDEGVSSLVTFTAEGRVEGHGGVNGFGGAYVVTGDEVELGPFFSTRMAGPPAAMAHETALLSALAGTRRFAVADDVLVVGDGDAEVRLRRAADESATEPL
jgi:heat shock protein HslJ